MASTRTYECFVCKRQGIDGVQVYLDGKDTEGRTKYLNEDMTAHVHHVPAIQSQQQAAVQKPTKEEVIPLLKLINAKLDRLLAMISDNSGTDYEERLGSGMLIE